MNLKLKVATNCLLTSTKKTDMKILLPIEHATVKLDIVNNYYIKYTRHIYYKNPTVQTDAFSDNRTSELKPHNGINS